MTPASKEDSRHEVVHNAAVALALLVASIVPLFQPQED